jgi:hypothetical protein
MDFSFLDILNTFNDKPNNHKNIPYPHLQIISGKTGSGKTFLLLQQLLTPGFLDYEQLYVLSPNINQKEYIFLKLGFEHNLPKDIMLELFPKINKFRVEQLPEVIQLVSQANFDNPTNIRTVFTNNKADLPLISEMDANTKKMFVFDDLAGDKEFENIIKNFFSKGRPNNCQSIYLTQQFSEVQPKSIRENTTCLSLFKTAGNSFDKVYSDMAKEVMENKKDFRAICDRAWKDKYAYIFINKIDDLLTSKLFFTE